MVVYNSQSDWVSMAINQPLEMISPHYIYIYPMTSYPNMSSSTEPGAQPNKDPHEVCSGSASLVVHHNLEETHQETPSCLG